MGETALHKSSRNCHQFVVNELLNYIKVKNVEKNVGDFVNIANDVGESSLHLSSKKSSKKTETGRNEDPNVKEDLKIVQSLMENGADVFMQTKEVSLFLSSK